MSDERTNYPCVLVVDDDDHATAAVVSVLSKHNLQLISANSGAECLQVLSEGLIPDVLVLDVLMPEMTGLEVCMEIRKNGRYNDIPIILLTACDDMETRAAGMKLGVSEFLCKPFAHHELLERIANQLEVRRISKQLDSVASQL